MIKSLWKSWKPWIGFCMLALPTLFAVGFSVYSHPEILQVIGLLLIIGTYLLISMWLMLND